MTEYQLPRAQKGRPRGFAPWRPQAKALDLVEQVKAVLEEYVRHLPLTLRQVFYRLVGRFGYDKTEKAYDGLCETLNRARRAQMIPFDAIRDDGVTRLDQVGWDDVPDCWNYIKHITERYTIDRQRGQERRVVLWCEAAGMAPQLARVGKPYSVPVYSSGGFDSVTVKHQMAELFAERNTHVLHIGDHDPSGVHVFGSLDEDVRAFAGAMGADVQFSRLAVLPQHIDQFNLLTAPPKPTDRRVFSGETVQAEALPPDVLAELVKQAIVEHLDMDVYDFALRQEEVERLELLERLGGAR